MNRARIDTLTLENIKSYEYAQITFDEGITIIAGENGSGKSTIFEAIGYCLFGVQAQKFIGNVDDFISRGKKRGAVTVEFTGIDDGKYRLSRSNTGYSALQFLTDNDWEDMEIENRSIPESAARLLGLASIDSPSDAFTDVIGPLQSEFIAPFVQSGKNREDTFNKILKIDKWRNLYGRTSNLDTNLKYKTEKINNEIRIKSEMINNLTEIVEEKEKKSDEISIKKTELEKTRLSYKKNEDEIARLETLEKQITGLTNLTEKQKGRMELKENQLLNSQIQLKESQASLDILNKNKTGFSLYQQAKSRRESLDKKQEEKQKLSLGLSELKKEEASRLSRWESQSQAYEKRKASIENRLQITLKEMKLRQNEFQLEEEKLQKVVTKKSEIAEETKKLDSIDIGILQRSLYDMENRLNQFNEKGKSIQKLENQIKKLPETEKKKSELETIETEIQELQNRITIIRNQIKDKEEGKRFLGQGTCPFFQEPCKNLQDKNTDDYFDKIIEEKTMHLKEMSIKKTELEQRKNELKDVPRILLALQLDSRSLAEEKRKLADIEQEIRQIIRPNDVKELAEEILCFISNSTFLDFNRQKTQLEELTADIEIPDELDLLIPFTGEIHNILDKICSELKNKIKSKLDTIDKSYQNLLENTTRLNTQITEQKKNIDNLNIELKEIEDARKALNEEKHKLNKLKSDISRIENDLVNYNDLQSQLENNKAVLSENEQAYNLYIAHMDRAENVNKLTSEIAQLTNEKKELEQNFKTNLAELDKLKKDFKPDTLKQLRETQKEDHAQLARTTEIINSIQSRIEALEKEIKKSMAIQEEIKQLEKECAEYEKTRAFTGFIRNDVINKIAPRVSTIIKAKISEIANGIYRDISTHNDELRWGDQYSIELVGRINNKIEVRRDQQLSGGQLMSAVIALRLALAQTLGAPFAFFDEPTSNLDEERRKNLVESIKKLDHQEKGWYRQLFLVSHDESFQEISSNIIELELDKNGHTRVIQN